MSAIKARIRVGPDHSISGVAPDQVPPGEHEATITVAETTAAAGAAQPAPRFFRAAELPVHDLPWDGSVSLRREDLYGDDGR